MLVKYGDEIVGDFTHLGNFTLIDRTRVITKYIRHHNNTKERKTNHAIAYCCYLGTVKGKVSVTCTRHIAC